MPLNLLTTIDWQISAVETTGWNVSSSLAFNPAGQPSIAYSNSSFELRFATQNADRTWAIGTVDTGLQNSGHPSLAFRLGQPAISYQWQQYASGQPGSYPRTQLRYALLRGTLWDINAVHAEF